MDNILLATHNEGKLNRYRNLFSGLKGINLVSLSDLSISDKVEEPYNDSLSNSSFKAKEYAKISSMPTIAVDEALRTNFLPENEQPGVFVRRFNKEKRELSDDDILLIWREIFSTYPRDKYIFYWDFSMSCFDFKRDKLHNSKAVQVDYSNAYFSDKINKGYPMSSFLIADGYRKPYVEIGEEDLLSIDRKNLKPFLDLIKNISF